MHQMESPNSAVCVLEHMYYILYGQVFSFKNFDIGLGYHFIVTIIV